MLEDTSYQHVVRWSEMGDSFIVLDVRPTYPSSVLRELTLSA